MKAKLIKVKGKEDYILDWDKVGYVATYESTIPYKLSLKNCQAIERGYDLDDLVEEIYQENNIKSVYDIDSHLSEKIGFRAGFQKALEILGDRRFTEEDMIKMWEAGANRVFIDNHPIPDYKPTIQSLQQNEWEVEIETIEYGIGNDEDGRPVIENRPKLDADGCLILKRV